MTKQFTSSAYKIENVRNSMCVLVKYILCESKNGMFVCLFACLLFVFWLFLFLCLSLFHLLLRFSLCSALCAPRRTTYIYCQEYWDGRDGKDVVVAYTRLQNARKHTRTNGANILWIKFHLICVFFFRYFFLFYFIWIAIGLSNVNNPLMLTLFPFNDKLKRKIHHHREKRKEKEFHSSTIAYVQLHTHAHTRYPIWLLWKIKWVDR